jgi:hypothetical protein
MFIGRSIDQHRRKPWAKASEVEARLSSKRGFQGGTYCRMVRNKKRPISLKALILLGWLMGFEPTTTGITIR